MTPVKFLIEIKDGKLPCNVFAFFPEEHYFEEGHPEYANMFTSYAHVGQHSGCHIDYVNGCKEAKHSKYKNLLNELIGQGYRDIKVLNSDRSETIDAGKIYQVYPDGQGDHLMFEGSKTSCMKWLKSSNKWSEYKRGAIRIGKVIDEA